jgi:hypothetical protein
VTRLFFGPSDWLVDHTTSRQRRAFGFWTFAISALLTPFFGREVLYVTLISIVALIPNFTSETPVEDES